MKDSEYTNRQLELLLQVDAALCSDEGLHVTGLAGEWGVTPKTIKRILAFVRSTGRKTCYKRQPDGTYRQWYINRRRPLLFDNA